ncbi:MAG: class I SAM-dependent rRNA methyltransferase [Acidobacteria bacterium]|nr:class I SAM-dependent rRNA methyltransferase [Acidobacteriota bacterium]
MPEPQVTLTPRGARRLLLGHHWVYRSDIQATDNLEPGDTVRLRDPGGRFLGKAWFSSRSQIAVRLIVRDDVPIDDDYLRRALQAAARFRQRVVENATAYRLVYGESDGLPTLIVDRYADTLVLQTLSQATERRQETFVRLLEELFHPTAILERNDPKVRLLEGLEQRVGVLAGSYDGEIEACENGRRFGYDLLHGQKTGAFLDQRENRGAAAGYIRGELLDCFCYTGGFALTAAAQASSVEGIDLSPAAVAAAQRNAERNQITNATFREANAFDVLKQYDEAGRRFDAVVLDPPAFAKNRASLPAARRGYKEINLRALKILRPGGLLVTCSCSHHVPESLLLEIVAEAAVDARRQLVVLERRTQARDHPILLTMPETHYLKALFLGVLS